MQKIEVYYKNNYGNVLCYPYCDRAKTFIKLTGYKTFNKYHLAQIRQLGYDIGNLEQYTIINIMLDEMCKVLLKDNKRFKKDIFERRARGL